MKIVHLKPLLGILLAAGTVGAFAAPAQGFYGGASLGVPHYQSDINGISGNGSGISGKLFGGYQVTPNFAVEAGIADLGHIQDPSAKVDGSSEYLDAVGIAPLNDTWSLLGRIGVAHVNLNTSNGDDNGTALKVGLGAQYALTSNIALRGEWERYHADAFGGKPNIDQFNVGVRYAF
jgi:OmpA-OmpF porin, OOP family